MATRDEIRGSIFNNVQQRREGREIDFFGQKIELRAPSLGAIINREGVINAVTILIENSYIPGTDEKVFEEADRDALMKLPFNADLMSVARALEELTGIDVKAEEGNLEAIQLS